MKKQILILLIISISFSVKAQLHNYDDQSVIYSLAPDLTGLNAKVGIGLTNPLEKLHVDGNLLLEAFDNDNDIHERGIFFNPVYDLDKKYGLSILTNKTKTSTGGALSVNGIGGIYFSTGSYQKNTRMFIDYNGNVGIGTEVPKAGLEVKNDKGIKIQSVEGSGKGATLRMTDGFSDVGIRDDLRFTSEGGFMFKLNSSTESANRNSNSEIKSFSVFNNSNANLFTIKENNGNVGIGTESPTSKLDVHGNAKMEKLIVNPPDGGFFAQMGEDIGNNLRLFNFGSSSSPSGTLDPPENLYVGYTIYSSNTKKRMDFSATNDQTYLGIRDNNEDEIFKASRSPGLGSFIHLPQADSRMVIGGFGSYLADEGYKFVVKDGKALVEESLIANEKIGIGTTALYNKLDIGNAFSFHDGGHEVIGFGYAPGVNHDLNPADYSSEIRMDGVNGRLSFGVSSEETVNPTTALTIDKDKNVGINVTPLSDTQFCVSSTSKAGIKSIVNHTTDYQFGIISAVNRGKTKAFSVLLSENGDFTDKFVVLGDGNVKATEVEVKTNIFPDYVFENDYDLMPLRQLESYIEEYKHLPNIPTADEVIENGLELGDMQVKQMEKIEELTLYIIDQDKRIEQLENAVKVLLESSNKN